MKAETYLNALVKVNNRIVILSLRNGKHIQVVRLRRKRQAAKFEARLRKLLHPAQAAE